MVEDVHAYHVTDRLQGLHMDYVFSLTDVKNYGLTHNSRQTRRYTRSSKWEKAAADIIIIVLGLFYLYVLFFTTGIHQSLTDSSKHDAAVLVLWRLAVT